VNIDILKNEIINDPLGIGYSQMTDQEVADSLNAKIRSKIVNRMVNERSVLAEFSTPLAAETFLQKLEAIATQNPIIKRAIRWMTPDQDGIDVGHPSTIDMINELVTAYVLTQNEADEFLNMAKQLCSRSEELGLGVVGDGHVKSVRK